MKYTHKILLAAALFGAATAASAATPATSSQSFAGRVVAGKCESGFVKVAVDYKDDPTALPGIIHKAQPPSPQFCMKADAALGVEQGDFVSWRKDADGTLVVLGKTKKTKR
ncbi:hypothetical protein D3C71_25210 [compost metagenome]